ncbi:hypothetical protein NEDG_01895 [Nematocida displodere]|uniref:Uncharacterized protein n=1 Tax=Nematocida displodere TaxID=1805483 RepID=A0A177EI22_9MICR|nr:hypothetical protein NEDG_01895 [Nematocida displodere]
MRIQNTWKVFGLALTETVGRGAHCWSDGGRCGGLLDPCARSLAPAQNTKVLCMNEQTISQGLHPVPANFQNGFITDKSILGVLAVFSVFSGLVFGAYVDRGLSWLVKGAQRLWQRLQKKEEVVPEPTIEVSKPEDLPPQ